MSIFFDSSTLISMAITCSLPVLRELKQAYGGDFCITDAVYQETIGKAMKSLRFRYEGYRLDTLLKEGTLKLYPDKPFRREIKELLNNVNKTYFAAGKSLNIVQLGEISALVASIRENADAIAIDERTARLLIEDPASLEPWLSHKLHTRISINKTNAEKWLPAISRNLIVLRSADLMRMAWEKKLLGSNKDTFFGSLWALKFAGCAITEKEIDYYMTLR